MGTVHKLDTNLYQEIGQGVALAEKGRGYVHDGWLLIAPAMYALRQSNKSDQGFGIALMEHGYEFGKNDRAAFVKMGGISEDKLKDAMELEDSLSPRHFVANVSRDSEGYFDVEPVSPRGDTDPEVQSTSSDVPVEVAEVEPAQVPEVQESQNNDAKPPVGYEATIKAHYIHKHFSFPKLKELLGVKRLKVLAEHISEGMLGVNNTSRPLSITARTIFSDYPEKWILDKQISGKGLVDNIDTFIDHHTRCAGNVSRENCKFIRSKMLNEEKDERANRAAEQNAALMAQFPSTAPTSSIISASGHKPIDIADDRHQDIVVCGQTIWSMGDADIDYLSAWSIFMFFSFTERNAARDHQNPAEVHDVSGRVSGPVMFMKHYLRNLMPENCVSFYGLCLHTQKNHASEYENTSAAAPMPRGS